MCNVNFVAEFNAFMRYAEDNMLSGRERLLWTALFHAANERAAWNEQTREFAWPDDFFPVSNDALHSNACLDKRAIADVRNTLKQQGLIDFIPGERNKRHPKYKLIYLTVGGKNVPNNDTNNTPNDRPTTPPIQLQEGTQDGTNDAPSNGASGAPDNKYKYYSKRDLSYIQNVRPEHLEIAERDLNIHDDHWRYSGRARAATAQQVVDAIVRDVYWGKLPGQTEGLYDTVLNAMNEYELSPLTIYIMAKDSATSARFVQRLTGAFPPNA
ncbi:MAG: hypothetical protein IJ466_07215 [Clostridia bacterium]|nr:hypothetical protein [Clostridia bacterium]